MEYRQTPIQPMLPELELYHELLSEIRNRKQIKTKPPITVFILLFGWICHWQRLVICCPQCTNTSLDCHWSNSVTWLDPKLLIGQQGFVGSFLYNWSKSNFIKNNNIEFNCLYFSYLVDRKWCQPSMLFLSCFLWYNFSFIF